MKKILLSLAFVLTIFGAQAQQAWWVFLSDKEGTTFDPYSYFDAKAIERYRQCGADLYDITNYPVSPAYEQGVANLATEEIGCSRWFNAMGVVATPEQAARIAELPYVLRVQPIEANGMTLASATQPLSHLATQLPEVPGLMDYATVDGPLEAQLVRMGGKAFRDKGIDGRGIRIAVFDGGFPQVNTHRAFKHLRDNNQIIKTWNFPNKKEDVYGWNSHGTMTLSCIAGRVFELDNDGNEYSRDLGLATGAEFLLARTEVETEPAKEEVWWQMAVEWADRNGANIISSSLGYGKERYCTKDMDGTAYVAKAGNMAARKGMLVVNSAGNEADDRQWKTIITPADADSVLCIGGIENSLTEYNHIEFSSYGPSADGRQKPNVCAFGYARTANVGRGDNKYHYVHGTSFSCPLVSGFAACAWQASPGKSVMELFHMIEQSADLYPYCDYSFGYGVPQAAYFTGDAKATEPTFRFVIEEDTVRVVPTRPIKHSHLFYSFRDPSDNQIIYYGKLEVKYADQGDAFTFSKCGIYNRIMTIHLAGYTDSLKFENDEIRKYEGRSDYTLWPLVSSEAVTSHLTGRNGDIVVSNFGSNAKWRGDVYFMLGLPVKLQDEELPFDGWSPATHFGVRLMRGFGKSYSLGLGIEWASTTYNYRGLASNRLDQLVGMAGIEDNLQTVSFRRVTLNEFSLEFFQRIRFVAGGIAGKGIHWDLGVYGSFGSPVYEVMGTTKDPATSYGVHYKLITPKPLDAYRWNYGLTTRLTYDFVGIYARYRLTGIGDQLADDKVLLPRLEIGIQLCL